MDLSFALLVCVLVFQAWPDEETCVQSMENVLIKHNVTKCPLDAGVLSKSQHYVLLTFSRLYRPFTV